MVKNSQKLPVFISKSIKKKLVKIRISIRQMRSFLCVKSKMSPNEKWLRIMQNNPFASMMSVVERESKKNPFYKLLSIAKIAQELSETFSNTLHINVSLIHRELCKKFIISVARKSVCISQMSLYSKFIITTLSHKYWQARHFYVHLTKKKINLNLHLNGNEVVQHFKGLFCLYHNFFP